MNEVVMNIAELLAPIKSFLQCETPQAWVDEAIKPKKFIGAVN
jgi:tRNA-(ms[2]io[6]A)-hydroxylase